MSLYFWRKRKLQKYKIHSLFYFSHKDNFCSILKNGILSKHQADEIRIPHTSFADEGVQKRREAKNIKLTDGKIYNLHDLVPLYLTPRTPTLFARKSKQYNFFFSVVKSFILCSKSTNFAFCDGNAGSKSTRFYCSLNKLDKIPWKVIRAERWDAFSDGKRQRNAEFLLHRKISMEHIWRFVVNNSNLKSDLEKKLKEFSLTKEVKIFNNYFF